MAFDALRANRLRSFLTTLGIIVGIVTVTLMGMSIEGLNNAFRQNVSMLGANTIYVERIPWAQNSYVDWLKLEKRPRIDLAQCKALERRITRASAIAYLTEGRKNVQYKNLTASRVSIIGTSDQFQFTSSLNMAQGRFLIPQEVEGGRPVCVLGWTVSSNLFPNQSPIGQKVRIGGDSVEVVGVVEKRGSFLGQYSFDNQVIIPSSLFLKTFQWEPNFVIQVKAPNEEILPDLVEEVRIQMRIIRRLKPTDEDDFAINQQQSILTSFARVSGVIGSVGLFISGLSLFVGGIGIMNIMFVSVAERTREIGVRKAIGAKRKSILIQFLMEAALICLAAGMLGLAIAWSTSLAISSRLPVTMSFRVAGLALAVSVAVGLIAGFLPAWRAARMSPVDALRNE